MDLFSLTRTIWRHKLVTLPVVMLTLLGCAAVMVVEKPIYQTTSTYILTSPPPAPTATQLALQPSLRKVNANNPYVNFGDLSIVADLVTKIVTTGPTQAELLAQGADPRYQAAPSQEFGNATPIIDVTGVGSTSATAVRTATLVGQALISTLKSMQSSQGVSQRYWIGTIEVTPPSAPQVQLSSKLRELIGVLAAGAILMFLLMSVMNALDERKKLKIAAAAPPEEIVEARPPLEFELPRPSWHRPPEADTAEQQNGDAESEVGGAVAAEPRSRARFALRSAGRRRSAAS